MLLPKYDFDTLPTAVVRSNHPGGNIVPRRWGYRTTAVGKQRKYGIGPRQVAHRQKKGGSEAVTQPHTSPSSAGHDRGERLTKSTAKGMAANQKLHTELEKHYDKNSCCKPSGRRVSHLTLRAKTRSMARVLSEGPEGMCCKEIRLWLVNVGEDRVVFLSIGNN